MRFPFHFSRIVSLVVLLSVGGYAADKAQPTPKAYNNDEIKKNVEKIVRERQMSLNAKAVLCVLTIGGQEVVNQAYGVSMTGMRATKEMHFRLGVPALMFTQTVMLQLVDQGKLSLDDKLSKWYPKLPNADKITVGMLARSMTGYADYSIAPSTLAAFKADPFRQWMPEALIPVGTSEPIHFAPGTNWEFSHTNFLILGQILHKILKKPMHQVIQEMILDPLKLKNTQYNTDSSIPMPVLHSYTSERGFYEENTYWNPSLFEYSGIMTSNLADMSTWMRSFGRGELISKKAYAERIAPTTAGLGGLPANVHFGLGALVNHGWIFLNPNFDGYTGVCAYLPSQDIAIVIYNIVNPGTPDTVNLSQTIFTEILTYLNGVQPIPMPALQ